ncbi:MAG: hypothetical protein JNL70_11690 [Saprospiraceae bacterium]|nr:hypothetical protein [Saprospiraceae bacterium]
MTEETEAPVGSSAIIILLIAGAIALVYYLKLPPSESQLLTQKAVLTNVKWQSQYRKGGTDYWLELSFLNYKNIMTVKGVNYSRLKIYEFKNEINYYDTLTIKYKDNNIYFLSKNDKPYISSVNR